MRMASETGIAGYGSRLVFGGVTLRSYKNHDSTNVALFISGFSHDEGLLHVNVLETLTLIRQTVRHLFWTIPLLYNGALLVEYRKRLEYFKKRSLWSHTYMAGPPNRDGLRFNTSDD